VQLVNANVEKKKQLNVSDPNGALFSRLNPFVHYQNAVAAPLEPMAQKPSSARA